MFLIVYVLGATIFALTTSEYMVVGLMPVLAVESGVSFAAIGYLVTFYAGAMVVSGPLLITALLWVPCKNALLGLIALSVVGQVTGALTPGYAMMVTARLVTAVATAVFFGVALTARAELVEGNQSGRASSLVLGGLMVGTVLGLPVATWSGEWYGWRASFFVVVLMVVLVGLLVLQLMPTILGSTDSGSLREELKMFRNTHLWWVYATSLLLIGATFAGFIYFIPILTEVSGFSASTVPLLLVVYGLATLVGNDIVGRLTDRHTIVALAFGLSAAIAVMVTFALSGQVPAVVVVALVVIGLTGVSMSPALTTRGARIDHDNIPVNSMHTVCITFGVMVGSWIGGPGTAGRFGLRGAFWVGTAPGVLVLLTLLPELHFARAPVGGALGR